MFSSKKATGRKNNGEEGVHSRQGGDGHAVPPESPYNTHLTLRCYSFNQCPSCSMCQNFDQHCAICVMCESRKMDGTRCICTDKQKALRQELERKMRRPMFAAPGMVAPPMAQGIVNDPEWKQLGDQIRENFTGVGVGNIQHTYTPTDETYKVNSGGDVFRV